jgi:hypothetical protein
VIILIKREYLSGQILLKSAMNPLFDFAKGGHAGHNHGGHSHGAKSISECKLDLRGYDVNLHIFGVIILIAVCLLGTTFPRITVKFMGEKVTNCSL